MRADEPPSRAGEPPRGRPGLWHRFRRWLPEGRALPEAEWRTRHRVIVLLVWIHVPLLFLFGVYGGRDTLLSYGIFEGFGLWHSFYEAGAIAVFGALASWPKLSRRARSVAASFGLVTASAILTHFSGGYIEAHFHFFVMIGVIAAYQDYVPFLLAIGYVAVHHGLAGSIDPSSVYNHPAAVAYPWRWAAIHAFFIAGLSAAELVHWRATERARARTDLVLESAGEGVLGLDPKGRITFANPAAAEMAGSEREELVGEDASALLTPEPGIEGPRALPDLTGLRSTHRGDGTWGRPLAGCPVAWVVSPAWEGEDRVGAVLTLTDITERRRHEKAQRQSAKELEASLSLLEATLEATEDGILVVDLDGNIVSHNDRFQELWGIPDDVLATGDDDVALDHVLDHLEDPDGFLEKVRELYAHPEAESHDEIRFEDGRVYERTSRPQRIGDRIVGRVWSFRDVTTEHNARTELEARAEALARSNAELERFAYIASHDLKEPLRMVSSYVQLLERRLGDDLTEETKTFIDYAVEGVTRMDKLLSGLLTYSRVDREFQPTDQIDAQELLEEVLRGLDPAIQDAQVTVTHDPLPGLQADRSQLGQVFQNLVANAIKFRRDEDPMVHIAHELEDGEHVFSVWDNGIGIDPQHRERIFDIFQRLNGRERYPGTGVGLAICKRIVESHGGRIWVESKAAVDPAEPGTDSGSTFRFTVPATSPEPADGGPPAAQA